MEPIAKATGGQCLHRSRTPTSCRPSTSRNRDWSASRSSSEKRFKPHRELPQRPDGGAAGRRAAAERLRADDAEAVAAGRDPDHARRKFADQDFPLLAYWHYGLGKAVAFTSDAGNPVGGLVEGDWAAGRHVRQVLGAGGRLVAAADGERAAADDDGVPRRQDPHHGRGADRRRRAGHEADSCAAASRPPTPAATRTRAKRELQFRAEQQRPVRSGDQGGGMPARISSTPRRCGR